MNALAELAEPLQSLHLLRPMVLWALLAIVPAAALWHWRRRDADVWRQSVDAHLLPELLRRRSARMAGIRAGCADLCVGSDCDERAELAADRASGVSIEHAAGGGAGSVVQCQCNRPAAFAPAAGARQAGDAAAQTCRWRGGIAGLCRRVSRLRH